VLGYLQTYLPLERQSNAQLNYRDSQERELEVVWHLYVENVEKAKEAGRGEGISEKFVEE
jgi:hypothetical protein